MWSLDTRVMGYFRPVSSFNIGKRIECWKNCISLKASKGLWRINYFEFMFWEKNFWQVKKFLLKTNWAVPVVASASVLETGCNSCLPEIFLLQMLKILISCYGFIICCWLADKISCVFVFTGLSLAVCLLLS